MPIYEYKCENGHVFDVMQRMSEDPLSSCQQCEAPVKRVFHPVAVHFKGSGFYNTDYGTRKRSREAKENAGSDGAGGEKKSDSKTSPDSKGSSEAKKAESSAAPASSSSSD